MADWVFAVERAYVAAANGPVPTGGDPAQRARAKAAAAAVASRFLAVGSPRSMSFVFDIGPEVEEAVLTLEAHRTWFAPVDLRCARSVPRKGALGRAESRIGADADARSITSGLGPGAEELAARIGGRAVTVAEALAADIVNVHGAYVAVTAAQLRRGTHVNVLGPRFVVDDELCALATCVDEDGLAALAAGLVDGRQLDELTVFFAGDAAIALAALG